MPLGAMAALGLGEEGARALMADLGVTDVDIAASNTLDNVTIAGPPESVQKIGVAASQKKLMFVALPIPRAYHSRYTEGLKDGFFADLKDFVPNSPRPGQSFYSTVTCQRVDTPLDINYWWSNVRGSVQFYKGLKELMPHTDILVEIGPHAVLSSFISAQVEAGKHISIASLRRSRQNTVDDVNELLSSVAQLYVNGVDIDWSAVQAPSASSLSRIDLRLPAPLWQHSSLRHGRFKNHYSPLNALPTPTSSKGKEKEKVKEVIKEKVIEVKVETANRAVGHLRLSEHAYLKDHVVKGVIAVPGAAFATLAFQLALQSGRTTNAVEGIFPLILLYVRVMTRLWSYPKTIRRVSLLPNILPLDIHFERFCEWLNPKETLELTSLFDGRSFAFEQKGTTNSRGTLSTRHLPSTLDPNGIAAAYARLSSSAKKLDMPKVYKALAEHSGIAFGETFRRLSEVHLPFR